jgi:Caspase domain
VASRSALIVANGEYHSAKLRRLRAPARDADALARVLRDPTIGDFDVELVRDQPEYVLRRRIARFFADRRRDDLLLLHISCHGLKDDDGQLFFATADTEFDDLDATAVPEDFVRRQMAKSRSGRILLLLDCCYSGAFSRGMAARTGPGVELKERFAGRGRAVITASNSMEYSFEGDELSGEGEPSIFTCAVVKALETGQADRDLDGWIAVDELYEYVYDEVSGTSPQHPVKWVDLEGDLRIAKSVYRPPAQPVDLPSDLRQAIESPERHTRLGAVHVLGDLLAAADTSLATAAAQALERLAHDDSRLVSEAADRVLAAAPAEPPAAPPMTKTEVPGEPGVESSTHDREALQGEDEDAFDTLTEATVDGGLASDFVSSGRADDAAAAPPDVRHEDFPPSDATGEATPAHSDESVAIPVKSTPGPPQPRTNFGEHPEPRATVTGQDATAAGLVPSLVLTGARAAGAAAVAGAIAAIASILPHSSEHRLASAGYRVPVALMSVGVILLLGFAFRSHRKTLLLAATGLGLALFGVTFPMSWPPGPLPQTAGFWLGACGAAVAASGAAVAAWLAYSEAPTAEVDASGPTQSRITRALLALPGPLIVIASLFILGEWGCKGAGCTNPTTWGHWTGGIHRYPSAVILLCGLVIALAVAGIWVNRRRLLVMGAAVSCLVLGEAVPLIYLDRGESPWGSGRWLRIAGAVVAVAGLAAAAAATGRDAPASQRYG